MKLLKTLTLIMLFMLSAGVSAHSKLMTTTPANDATISESPEQIMLAFNRNVRLLKVELIPDGGDAVDIGFKPMMKKAEEFAVALPKLEAANYLVKWIAMGGDGHKMKGEFSFSLGAATDTTDSDGDGIQDATEAGVANLKVDLLDYNLCPLKLIMKPKYKLMLLQQY